MKRTKELAVKVTGALLAAVIAAVSAPGFGQSVPNVYAVEFTVTESKAVLYSNENVKVYRQPDINSGVVTTLAKDMPVNVTGITSNGWFRVSINGTYYIPGDGLVSKKCRDKCRGGRN